MRLFDRLLRLGQDAVTQSRSIDQTAPRQIDDAGRNDLPALLVTCEHLECYAGFPKGPGHRCDRVGIKGRFIN